MMPQREANQSPDEQVDSSYGRYEGDQTYTQQQFETPYQQPLQGGPAGKVYATAPDNKNVLRLIAFGMAMVALIIFGVLCLIFVGGTAGWISFCAASLAIFIIAVVAIDKIK
ncbi:MAG: hypothetical protein M3Y39_18165 [Chloroflexota bacterium]|nr:hypothetical protein [Chloroflexota bacterium]